MADLTGLAVDGEGDGFQVEALDPFPGEQEWVAGDTGALVRSAHLTVGDLGSTVLCLSQSLHPPSTLLISSKISGSSSVSVLETPRMEA